MHMNAEKMGRFNAMVKEFADERNANLYDGVPEITKVVFNNPATIVLWTDGTKTVVKCQGDDVYSKETGLALCIAKKALGNKSNFNEVFKKWIPEEETEATAVLKVASINSRPPYPTIDFKDVVNELINGAFKKRGMET